MPLLSIVRYPIENTYSSGQVVYINRKPNRSSPPPDATEDEMLRFDKENFWVGLIAEFRAEDQENVYVRVFWLYWPDELPMGRQSYHGDRELVLSNHVDIIEAQTIACHAEVSSWDESDDSNKTVLHERYWRQTYDISKVGTSALSKLRQYCVCGGYDNPNLDMYQCKAVGCGLWNHEACLLEDLEEKAWEKFRAGSLSLERELKIKQEPRSDSPSASGASKKPKATKGKKPWKGKLEAKVTKTKRTNGEDMHTGMVTQLVPSATSKPKATPSFEPRVWIMELKCLKCGESLN